MAVPWWQQPVRMMRVDYAPDFSIVKTMDLDKLAKSRVEEWAVNCEWVVGTLGFAGGGWQTTFKAEGYVPAPGFETFDYLRSYTPYAHKYGLKVSSYLNLHWFSYDFADNHPGWEQVISDGRAYGRVEPLYGNGTTMCVNGPWRDWAFGLIKEAMKTGIDGLFLDGPLFYPDCCHCETCRKEFKARYGTKIPKEDWQDPLWKTFLDYREDSLTRFMADARQAMREINPEGAIFLNAGSWQPGNWRHGIDNQKLSKVQTFNAAESFFHYFRPQNPYDTLMTAKFLRGAGIPAVVFSHYMNGSWHYLNLPAGEIQLAFAQTLAGGANPWLALMNPSLQSQPESPEPVREIFEFQERYREFFVDIKPVAEVGILFSNRTARDYMSNQEGVYEKIEQKKEENLVAVQKKQKITNWPGRKNLCEEIIRDARAGYFQALTEGHVLFDVLLDGQIEGEKLSKYKTVLLPDGACLTAGEAEALKCFVANGGNLVASFEAGFYDEKGQLTDRMFDLLGIEEVEGVFPVMLGENYLQATEGFLTWKKGNILERGPNALKVKARSGTQTPFFFVEPIPSLYMPIKGISSYPAMIIHRYGKGKIAYFPEAIGHFYGRTGMISAEERILKTIRSFQDQSLLEVKAPGSVSVEMYSQPGKNRWIIHLVNNSTAGRPVKEFLEVRDIQLTLRIPKPPKKVFALRENPDVKHSIAPEGITIKNIRLKMYEILVMEF
jgi:hypothetical protein